MENRGTQTDEMDCHRIQIPRSTQTISVVARSVETSIESDHFDESNYKSDESKDKVPECSLEIATQTDFHLRVSNFQMQPIEQPRSQYLLPNLISSKLLAVAAGIQTTKNCANHTQDVHLLMLKSN